LFKVNFPEIMLPDDELNMENTGEIASGSKPGMDATIPPRRDPGEGFKRAWPPCEDEAPKEQRLTLIRMDEAVKAKVEKSLK
jgi:hypothetical protein